jgi:hypothetical protein
MTLAQFYALLPAINWRWKWRCAGAAFRLGDHFARGLAAAPAIAEVTAHKRYLVPLNAAGLLDEFQSITGP